MLTLISSLPNVLKSVDIPGLGKKESGKFFIGLADPARVIDHRDSARKFFKDAGHGDKIFVNRRLFSDKDKIEIFDIKHFPPAAEKVLFDWTPPALWFRGEP